MRAIEVTEFGGPDDLHLVERPDPRPAAGQVLIEATASGVLGIDTVIRAGHGGDAFPTTVPYVPGAGAAGIVLAVGPGVSQRLLGRAVVASMPSGGYAELAVATEQDVLEIPDGVSDLDAMAVLHDGRTAIAVLAEIGVRSGETLLVTPAAGGLGSCAVQLAAGSGARVVALARGAAKAAVLHDLGAEVVVDQAEVDWTRRVREALGSGTPVDVALDGVGGATSKDVLSLVRDGGRYSNYGFAAGDGPAIPDPDELRRRRITHRGMDQLAEFAAAHRERGIEALRHVADGTLRPLIGTTLPLEQAAAAHLALQQHTTLGKTLLVVSPPAR